MPELPEVETVASGLRNLISGDSIVSVDVLRKESIAYPSVRQFCKSLAGHTVLNVGRRGKYVLIKLSGGASLVVHLRMSGRLIVRGKDEAADRFLRVKIKLGSDRELHFEDMRVFGRLWYVAEDEKLEDIVCGIKTLGVEPLNGLDDSYLLKCFKKKKQPVKNALLDQRIIAGIGNIYADESLFLSGIHPQRSAGSLKPEEVKKLVKTVKKVLKQAIKHGGSSLRDYRTASGVNGNYQNEAWVYGRKGKTCRSCNKSAIEQVRLAGRSTCFCPVCQKR